MKELKQIVKQLKERGKTLVEAFGWTRLAIVTAAVLALVFLSIPKRSTKSTDTAQRKQTQDTAQSGDAQVDTDAEEAYARQMEQQLENLLQQVEGVGAVEVMITLKTSSQTVLNKDISKSESSRQDGEQESGSSLGEQEQQTEYQEETVLVEDGDGNQTPTVVKTIEPEVAGVLVICEGGGNPQVVSDITSAAEVLFSVSAHKVKVMKKGS